MHTVSTHILPDNTRSSTSPAGDERAPAAALAQRYSRKPLPPLTFEFTRDPAYLHQLYRLREDEYHDYLGLHRSVGSEGESDHSGHIVVVRAGNQVLGGARINTKTPGSSGLLPLELADFRLEQLFPQLQHKQLAYGEVGSLVLSPELRGGDVVRELMKRLVAKCMALNLAVVFARCPTAQARLYKQVCMSLGLKGTKVHLDIQMPLYKHVEEMKLFLVSISFDDVFRGMAAGASLA